MKDTPDEGNTQLNKDYQQPHFVEINGLRANSWDTLF
jgi:hypothetical protein